MSAATPETAPVLRPKSAPEEALIPLIQHIEDIRGKIRYSIDLVNHLEEASRNIKYAIEGTRDEMTPISETQMDTLNQAVPELQKLQNSLAEAVNSLKGKTSSVNVTGYFRNRRSCFFLKKS